VCLAEVSSGAERSKVGLVEGWKVFESRPWWTLASLASLHCQNRGGLREGDWIQSDAPMRRAEDNPHSQYKAGWHIYLNRGDAEMEKCSDRAVRRVFGRGILAKGWEGSRRVAVVVCRELFIPFEPPEPKPEPGPKPDTTVAA
jgi:hypothetical protein